MPLHPYFVPGGVYLRTTTGELIGRLDKPGAPFETLAEAHDRLDWLEMVVQFQHEQNQRDLISVRRAMADGKANGGNTWSA